MGSFYRYSQGDDLFIQGPGRVLFADITQARPNDIGDVIELTSAGTLYDPKVGWTDLGATKTGSTIEVNNSEDAYTVDQEATAVRRKATSWEASVSTAFAEVDLERIQLAWEGGPITTLASGQRRMGVGTPTTLVQRRVAVLHRRENGKIRMHSFHICQRTPQASQIALQQGGDQVAIPHRWAVLPDASIVTVKERLFYIFDQ